MNENCEIVRDLLPLYADEVCSSGTKVLVEQHLSDCGECRQYFEQLKNNEAGESLLLETDSVVSRHKAVFRRKSFTVGLVFACIFTLPVLVCLIVNLASGEGLNWFYIVLTSLLLPAALIVVPLMVPRRRFLNTLCASTLSLLLLLLACALYTGGKWFFVTASACVFGIALVFLPIAVHREPLDALLGRQKGLAVMAADTLLFALMMFSIGRFNGVPGFWRASMLISGYPLIFVWALFAVIRYLPARKLTRTGVCCVLCGGFLFSIENVINYLLGLAPVKYGFYPTVWNAETLDGNIKWTLLLLGVVLGVIFMIIGLCGKEKKK